VSNKSQNTNEPENKGRVKVEDLDQPVAEELSPEEAAKVKGGDQSGNNPDPVLLHELVHAMK
jgi:hypothetical protein